MKNIDLHCHPSQKTMLTKAGTPENHVEFKTKISIFTDEMIGDILDSQSNINRLIEGDFKLVFWSIYTMEREVISVSRIQEAIRRERNEDLIDVDYLDKVKKAEVNYFDYMNKEWQIMKDAVDNHPQLKLINHIDEMEADKMNIFPSLEGAHAFITSIDEKDFMDVDVIDRFRTFIANEPLSFITLTHFTDKQLFTHCFALKLVSKKELVESNFYPQHLSEKGYSELGEQLMNVCLDANKAFDIKHVSLLGRLNIYDHIKNNVLGFSRLLCSHAGIAGLSYKEFLKNKLIPKDDTDNINKNKIFKNRDGYIVKLMFDRQMGPLKMEFNSQMINLYDEDITSIIAIGGVIGISIDQRILGASTLLDRVGQLLNYHSDYVTLEEFILLCRRAGIRPEEYLGENYLDDLDRGLISIDDIQDSAGDRTRGVMKWKRRHRKRFAQSIMHIIDVGLAVSDTPWNHIALGSDYDGLVDALNCCTNSEEVPRFKKDLIKIFEKLIKEGRYRIAISPEDLIKRIFEENMIDFYRR